MRNEREVSFSGRRETGAGAGTRPQLRWTSVTGADGRTRLEMRWDVRNPAPRRVPAYSRSAA